MSGPGAKSRPCRSGRNSGSRCATPTNLEAYNLSARKGADRKVASGGSRGCPVVRKAICARPEYAEAHRVCAKDASIERHVTARFGRRAQAALAMVYFRSFDQHWSGSLGISADQAFRKARDYLNRAKAHPTSTSHQVAGNLSRERGWYDDAIKEFGAAIALDPSNSWSYADQAYAMIWAGRPAEAEAQIEKAMRLDPSTHPSSCSIWGWRNSPRSRCRKRQRPSRRPTG